jgi:hypothetical protein
LAALLNESGTSGSEYEGQAEEETEPESEGEPEDEEVNANSKDKKKKKKGLIAREQVSAAVAAMSDDPDRETLNQTAG